jgi:ABC-type dipeptide/oligopeptide/nickel transport system permease subunit
MKTKLMLAVLALAVSPTVALAMGCSSGHVKDEIVMSCADGMTYDAQTQGCIPLSTS